MAKLEYAKHGRTFITSDTHFGHEKACELFDRQYSDLASMEAALISNFNSNMGPDDTLYHLGDFVGEMPTANMKITKAKDIREQLHVGKIILIRGNHDPCKKKYDGIFNEVHEMYSCKGWKNGKERITLCHYPMRVWRGNRTGSIHMHGHAHGRLEEMGKSTDVGVDCWESTPIEIDHVIEMLNRRDPHLIPGRKIRQQPNRRP